MENKEGNLLIYTGFLSGWQKRYFVIDISNGYIAYGLKKDKLFNSSSYSETIPACIVLDANINGNDGITVSLNNKRKIELKIIGKDNPNEWVDAIFSLSNRIPNRIASDLSASFSNSEKVRVTFSTPSNLSSPSGSAVNKVISKEYDSLFVACDPCSLKGVMPMSAAEETIFNALIRYTFHTTLIKAKATSDVSNFDRRGRVAPSIQRKMDGNLYAYRNETMKQFGGNVATDTYWLTGYQILSHDKLMSNEELSDILKVNLTTTKWFPFKEYEIAETFHCAYFAHFTNEDLVRGLLWKLIEIQGSHKTMYIHGSSCFESVLHIWEYHEMIFNQTDAPMMLPTSHNGPIAIIGAGPAGLLMAVRLARMGYTNIDIIEASDRVGGKSVSIAKDSPNGKVVCELGTCYLSADYEPFRNYFAEYIEKEQPVSGVVDRNIVTDGDFKLKNDVKKIEKFTDYALAKAMEDNDLVGFENLTRADVLYDFYKYSEIHEKIFDGERPFPRYQPKELLGVFGKQTYDQFLRSHGLESLLGILQYAYQAQGYGSLETVPAFYGLVWITPSMIFSMFTDIINTTLDPNKLPDTISYIKNGWSSVWANVVKKNKFNIHFNATVTQIERPN